MSPTSKRQKTHHDGDMLDQELPSTASPSMLQLQLDEMLAGLQSGQDQRMASIDEALRKLKTMIEAIEDREPVSVTSSVGSVTIPYPSPKPPSDAAYKLAYQKPASINVVGSYALKTMIKGDEPVAVDMVVAMPSSIFQEKDYLNHRYFYKRAYYLACIAAGLKKEFSLQFEYFRGNNLLPIIVVDLSAKQRVNILLAAPDVFPAKKLSQTSNCIRAVEGKSTPFYNSTLASDVAIFPYLKLFHATAKSCPAFKEACTLGRVWLRQRGFSSDVTAGGFGAFEWSALLALLLQNQTLQSTYSSYQIFKTMIKYLAATNLGSTPVFHDQSRNVNVLYKMTTWSYSLLRTEAATTFELLNQKGLDPFDATFIVKADSKLLKYDAAVRLETSDPQKAYSVFSKGLTDRVKSINVHLPASEGWDLKQQPPSPPSSVMIYFIFDPANIDRVVDHGPTVEEKTLSEKYRQFWGEKAELRRFRDGSILESVIWSSNPFQEITKYLSKRHFATQPEFVADAGSFDKLLGAPSADAFKQLFEAYKAFEKDIQELEELPLNLRQLSPVCAQLRMASTELPRFSPQQPLATPAEVVLNFEGSGRWPDDIVAIQRTKVAFLIRIGALLESRAVARVGLENHDKPLRNCGFLDVQYPSGAVFRLRIQNDREQTLLERLTKNKTIDSTLKEEAITALAIQKRLFVQLPLHNQSIRTYCTRMPLLSPTIRLVKKWFASHMLSNHVSEELIELIVMKTFLQPQPWKTPSSTMTGFLRVLQFISRWDWRADPLVVDFDDAISVAASASTRLQAWRKIDPQMNRTVLFAASTHDESGIAFTANGPSKVVATRMTLLARAASKLVKDQGLELEPRALFVARTEDYDFVIHLKSSKPSQFKNLAKSSSPTPAFLAELSALYSTSIVFFDSLEKSMIAGIWNPLVASKPFKVNMTHAVKLESDDVAVIDKPAILSEIARLGGDMISSISS